MAEEYRYFDGEPIILKQGEHGLGNKFDEEDMGFVRVIGKNDYVYPLYVVPQSQDITDIALVASRENKSSSAFSCFNQIPIVEFIYFGRSHRYHARDYPEIAPYWRNNVFTEARVLARSLQGDQAIAYEFLEGDGSLGAWMTHGIRAVADIFRKTPIPKPEEYDPLMKRVWDISDKVKAASAADYPLIHEAGIEFMRVRYEQAHLTRRIRRRIEELIDAAGWGLTAATEIESNAFAVLDLYGQVRYQSDPASLAAYRCGVLLVRAGARYIGEITADNSQRKAIWEAGVKVREDLPKAVSGLLLGYIKKGFKNPNQPTAMEAFAEELVGIQVWFLFFTVDFFVFEAQQLSAADEAKINDKYFEKLAPELATQIFSAVVKIGFVHKLNGLPADSKAREWLGKLATALPALIGAVIKEYVAIKERADQEKRPFYEVFCSEAGWALVRIFKAVGTALAQDYIQDAMKKKMASDKEAWNENYWKALILSIKLHLSEVNPNLVSASKQPAPIVSHSTASGQSPEAILKGLPATAPDPASVKPLAWNQKVPRTAPGPDKNGNIGMNKLKPAAAEPNPIDKTKPPKPTKQKRKETKLAPKENIRAGEEFSEARIKATFELSEQEVRRKWESDFKGKEPHYMCENCHFVNPDKSKFNVDHVWDIQHGGKADRWTKAEIEKILASNDPSLLYERGVNSMLLCKGCNLAKNTKFDNSPGFIPKGAGYAVKRHEEDKNPDHLYSGPPKD